MIRQLGTHEGKDVVFGFDRYLEPELGDYLEVLSHYGPVVQAVDNDQLHYLSSAQRVCERVQHDAGAVGVLSCGTGMGMSIAANKFRSIYAARCVTVEDAKMARSINNANVLCIASINGMALNAQIIDEFMRTPFEGRKLEQLEYIAQFELEVNPAPVVAERRVNAPRILQKTA